MIQYGFMMFLIYSNGPYYTVLYNIDYIYCMLYGVGMYGKDYTMHATS